ncbi:unnamed protein product [Ambrosiozyma monospora]|uniref:Unnamed protein product n=1 Tax=Ambrosiozyma monospora TaxID=43982 RepID=A0ACB5T2H4_AMBMO|nr:unnamed protein product [Ambrosiozyma monospora]
MSFDINWESIYSDDSIRDYLQDFLNEKLSSIALPNYLNDLKIVKFSLGDKSPQLTIKDISYPFQEFYSNPEIPLFIQQQQQAQQAQAQAQAQQAQSQGQATRISGGPPLPPPRQSSVNALINGHSRKRPTLPTTWEAATSRSPSPITLGSKFNNNRPGTPTNILNSPIASKPSSILTGRSNSTHFLTSGGVGLGGFGLMEQQMDEENGGDGMHQRETQLDDDKEQQAEEYHSVPMNTNLSIDGEMNDDSVDSSTVHTSPVSKQQREREREQRGQQTRSQDDENGDMTKFDLQLTMDFKWDSSMYIEVVCSLLVNYPAPEFIKLPVRLKITNLSIHSLAIVAYLDKKVFLSFLCDIDDDENDLAAGYGNGEGGAGANDNNLNQAAPTGSPTEGRQDSRKSSITELHHIPSLNRERIDIIKNLKIEGELGNCDQMNQHIDASNGSILRNIGKIEKFLVTALRTLLIKELGWPSWIELDFNDDEDEDSDEEDSEEESDASAGNETDPEQTLL